MELDEAITMLKLNNKQYLKNDDLQQLAEWLEELKAYKSDDFTSGLQTLVYKQGYNKAIDDFSESVKNLITDSSVIRFKDIDEIAEQLKLACFTSREIQQYRAIGTPEDAGNDRKLIQVPVPVGEKV